MMQFILWIRWPVTRRISYALQNCSVLMTHALRLMSLRNLMVIELNGWKGMDSAFYAS